MSSGFYIIPKIGGIAYLNMPKSACTSVLRTLAMMRSSNLIVFPDKLLDDGSDPIHGFHPPNLNLDYYFGRWLFDYPPLPSGYIRFTFVRNPYARFYSFYKSKIKMQQTPAGHYKQFGMDKNTSFADCVYTITSLPTDQLEHHALPQSLLITTNEGLRVDFVGNVENFENDWKVINDLSGFNIALGRNNSMKDAATSEYTPELKKRIYEYYRDDFLLLGYDENMVDVVVATEFGSPKEINSEHLMNDAQIEAYRSELLISSDRIRRLSGEFAANPELRKKYFKNQGEQFRELLQKSLHVAHDRINTLNGRVEQARHAAEARISAQASDIQEIKKQILVENKDKNNEKRLLRSSRRIFERQLLMLFALRQNSIGLRIKRLFYFTFWRDLRLLRASGLIDPYFYFAKNPEVINSGMSAAVHYLRYGAKEGRDPSNKFNTIDYIVQNPDVVYKGINPLVHYITSRK